MEFGRMGVEVTTNKTICIFSAQYLPCMGGVERYTDYIARKLSARGFEVTIVTSDLYGAPVYEEAGNIKIYRLPSIGCLNNRYPVIKFNSEYRKMIKEICKLNYGLVIVNTRFYMLSLIGAYIGRKYGKHCICIEHGTMHMTLHNPILDKLEQLFEHTISAAVKHYIKEFYGVSQACNEWLKHFGIKAQSVLYNAVDVEEIREINDVSNMDILKKFHLPSDGTLIAFTGRILKEKGIVQLLEAFGRLRCEHKKIYLVIAGEGPLKDDLTSDRTEGVYFLGKISYQEVVLLLTRTDIFCLPSDSEGMPTSVLEAIACKNFIITTEMGGAKEILLDSDYGIVLPDNEVQKVYGALDRAIKDPVYRKKAIEKSYNRLVDHFTWDRVIDKLVGIISEKDDKTV